FAQSLRRIGRDTTGTDHNARGGHQNSGLIPSRDEKRVQPQSSCVCSKSRRRRACCKLQAMCHQGSVICGGILPQAAKRPVERWRSLQPKNNKGSVRYERAHTTCRAPLPAHSTPAPAHTPARKSFATDSALSATTHAIQCSNTDP